MDNLDEVILAGFLGREYRNGFKSAQKQMRHCKKNDPARWELFLAGKCHFRKLDYTKPSFDQD